jgi:prophage tail gpP-like protein
MIELEINNIIYKDFKSFNVRRDIESITGEFTLDITRGLINTMPVSLFQPVRILVYGKPIVTGRIETIQTSSNSQTNTIQLRGRDITADLVDSTVGPLTKFSGNVSLHFIIQTYLNYLGLSSIKIINEAGTLAPFRADELIQFKPSDTCYNVCDRYAKKRQVLLNTDGNGNIIITKPNDDDSVFDVTQDSDGNFSFKQVLAKPKDKVFLELRKNSDSNNVINATVNIDMTKRFNNYTARAEQNPASQANRKTTKPSKLLSTLYTTKDDAVPGSRKVDLFFDSVTRPEDVRQRLEWQKNYNIANSFEYSATIPGITQTATNMPIKPNTPCYIVDELNGIDDILLIGAVEYSLSVGEGLVTRLSVKHPNAYESFDTKKPKKKKRKKGKRKKVRIQDAGFFQDVLKFIEEVD